jgi:hypothetical protein
MKKPRMTRICADQDVSFVPFGDMFTIFSFSFVLFAFFAAKFFQTSKKASHKVHGGRASLSRNQRLCGGLGALPPNRPRHF